MNVLADRAEERGSSASSLPETRRRRVLLDRGDGRPASCTQDDARYVSCRRCDETYSTTSPGGSHCAFLWAFRTRSPSTPRRRTRPVDYGCGPGRPSRRRRSASCPRGGLRGGARTATTGINTKLLVALEASVSLSTSTTSAWRTRPSPFGTRAISRRPRDRRDACSIAACRFLYVRRDGLDSTTSDQADAGPRPPPTLAELPRASYSIFCRFSKVIFLAWAERRVPRIRGRARGRGRDRSGVHGVTADDRAAAHDTRVAVDDARPRPRRPRERRPGFSTSGRRWRPELARNAATPRRRHRRRARQRRLWCRAGRTRFPLRALRAATAPAPSPWRHEKPEFLARRL